MFYIITTCVEGEKPFLSFMNIFNFPLCPGFGSIQSTLHAREEIG